MELNIIRAQEFVRLGAHGRYDLKASKAALAQLAAACWKRGIHQALLDLRAIQFGPKPVFTPDDLVVLVNTFREIGFSRKQKLAVLYDTDPHHRARLFTLIAKLRGWKVQAFDNFENALIWLSSGAETPAETEFTPRAKKVPVRQAAAVTAHVPSVPQPKIVIKPAVPQPRATVSVHPVKARPASTNLPSSTPTGRTR